jgi:L-arabinokinase
MRAVCAALNIKIAPREMALFCQKAENEVVGAPCGVMDQIASNCGSENKLIAILCQPAEIQAEIEIPEDVEFWGIDSGVRHAVKGSDYTSVRIGAFMGYRIIADLAGLQFRQMGSSLVEIEDDRWHGYLANVSSSEYEQVFASGVPETIGGTDFIDKYVGSTDHVTRIEPEKTYAVKAPTEHAVYESLRVRTFSEKLKRPNGRSDLLALGKLMFQSHSSYAACGLTEPGTDRIVELVRANCDKGLFGARITGGGSGGTVAILARRGSKHVVSKLSAEYANETGHQPYIFSGSSPGSAEFGYLRLENTVA